MLLTEGYSLTSLITSTITFSDLVIALAQKPTFSCSQLYCLVSSRMQSRMEVSILLVTAKDTSRLYSFPNSRRIISRKGTYSQPQTFQVLWQATKAPSMRPILSWKAYFMKAPRTRSQYSRSKEDTKPRTLSIGQSRQSAQFSTSQRMGQQARVLISNTNWLPCRSISLQSICDRSSRLLLTAQQRQQLYGFFSTRPDSSMAAMVYGVLVSRYSPRVPTCSSTSLVRSSLQPLSLSIEQLLPPLRLRQKVTGFLKCAMCSRLMPWFYSQMLSKLGRLNMLSRQQRWYSATDTFDVEEEYLQFACLLISCSRKSSEGGLQSDICDISSGLISGNLPKPMSPTWIFPSSSLFSPCCSLGILSKSGVSSQLWIRSDSKLNSSASGGHLSLILN